MAEVDLKAVKKVYPNGLEAVKGVSIAIPDKALCVLVGPSGCGKSTLLRMVAGLETISGGEIDIGGRVVNEVSPTDRDIAMVFQNYALYPHMKVYDNMAYGLRNRGTPKDEIDRRVREAAATLELGHLLDRRPRELSGGQRQRVAMGRAIVRQPKVFLFDEPLSNLDAKLRGQMRVEIKRLQRELGVTSLYVTHDQLEAMTLADLLVVMNGGAVEQAGDPLEIYDRPASIFVAGFIGAPPMNLVKPAAAEILGAAPSGAVTLGFRPEDVLLDGSAPEGGMRLRAVLDGVEPVGAESYLHAHGAEGARMILRAPGRARLEPGTELEIRAPAEKLHWFDAQGKRL